MRRLTAGVAVLGLAVGLWLVLVPYRQRIPIGRMELAGRCGPAIATAFTRVPDNPFYDLGAGEGLPAELCAPGARGRVAGGTAFCLFAAAILIAGRTTWRRHVDDE